MALFQKVSGFHAAPLSDFVSFEGWRDGGMDSPSADSESPTTGRGCVGVCMSRSVRREASRPTAAVDASQERRRAAMWYPWDTLGLLRGVRMPP